MKNSDILQTSSNTKCKPNLMQFAEESEKDSLGEHHYKKKLKGTVQRNFNYVFDIYG
jgi:hypothetical protein